MNNAVSASPRARQSLPPPDRVALLTLLFGVLGAPVAWGLQLVVNYGLASHICYVGDTPRTMPIWRSAWTVILVLNVLAALLALASTALSYQRWQATRQEFHRNASEALEVREGRTRFLALWGVMTGSGFFLAILFNTIALFMVPQCIG